jgi:eukaryotic-like serine/threonine-protein kinase
MGVDLVVGDRIGNYRIEAELGPTGSSVLLSGRHLVLPRQAIVKLLHPGFAAHRPYALQMLREACILEAIAHPGAPLVYESGVLGGRRPWFAFELISGTTLDELLLSGALAAVEVAGLLRDLAEILEHAHRRGVIHRGLRPDRIVLTSERRFPLCIPDWSEAIAHDASSDAPVVSPDSSGSYRAPELASQLAGSSHELIDDRADMFALGVIGYRALTGRLPVAPAAAAPYRSVAELCPEVPSELAVIVDSLLAHDRFDRPTSSEVRVDLDWLFETVPALAVADRQAGWARAETEPDGRRAPTRAEGTGPISGSEPDARARDVALRDPPRLRRPRWTPDVGYLERTPVDFAISEDDLTDK